MLTHVRSGTHGVVCKILAGCSETMVHPSDGDAYALVVAKIDVWIAYVFSRTIVAHDVALTKCGIRSSEEGVVGQALLGAHDARTTLQTHRSSAGSDGGDQDCEKDADLAHAVGSHDAALWLFCVVYSSLVFSFKVLIRETAGVIAWREMASRK